MNKKFKMIIILLVSISIIITLVLSGYIKKDEPEVGRDYKQDMRDFVQGISAFAKVAEPDFIIIPQNGHELMIEESDGVETPVIEYLNAIDGAGQEDLFYGYDNDNTATPASVRNYLTGLIDIGENNGVEVLITDYTWDHDKMDYSYEQNSGLDYISFAADHRELDNIPTYPATPYNVNSRDIGSLAEASNFLYLINPSSFDTKADFLNAVKNTDYDIIIMDLFFDGVEELSSEEVTSLKVKANGGTRLVIAYMSIGEVEDYRYYWNSDWEMDPPSWLAEENPDWPGNYKINYWDPNWQNIIYGKDYSYLKKILDAGFDGVYLDIIDAYEYFEEQ